LDFDVLGRTRKNESSAGAGSQADENMYSPASFGYDKVTLFL
jgi:hypothetical protein